MPGIVRMSAAGWRHPQRKCDGSRGEIGQPIRCPRIIFITGTDTGVGKTLLTGLLLHHLRQSGCHALAMKPFCSGSRADAEFLHAVQDGELTLDEINPFFFAEPLAPLVAAREQPPFRSVCRKFCGGSRRLPAVASACSSRELAACWCPSGRALRCGI